MMTGFKQLISALKAMQNALCFFSLVGIVLLIFYWRIIYVREPRLVSFEFSWLHIICGIYIIVFCSIFLWKQLVNVKSDSVTNIYFSSLRNIYSTLLDNYFINVFAFIIEFRIGIIALRKLAINIMKYHTLKFRIYRWYFIFVTLPSFFYSIVFFVDVVIFHYLYYSFKLIPLLMVPIIVLILKRILKLWAQGGLIELEAIIVVTTLEANPNDDEEVVYTKQSCDWHPDYQFSPDEDMDQYIEVYAFFSEVDLMLYCCDTSLEKPLIKLFNILRTIFVIITWVYWLTRMFI